MIYIIYIYIYSIKYHLNNIYYNIFLARERIKINRELISQEDMIKYGNIALNLLENENWSVFFDYLLTISILYFNDNYIDYLILETGIGGRYDSTNFIINPILCIITSISLDHQRLLGNTIEEITLQKAGIIKNKIPILTSKNQLQIVKNIFLDECLKLNTVLYEVPVNM